MNDLSLVLRSSSRDYEKGDSRNVLGLRLVNHGKKVRAVDEMPAYANLLQYCSALSFLIRFQNGVIVEVPNEVPRGRSIEEMEKIRFRPLALPAEGETIGEIRLGKLFEARGELASAFEQCKAFSVTVLVKDLKLRSNTIYFNGCEVPKEDPDVFKEAEKYQKQKKEKRDGEQKAADEAQQRKFREFLEEEKKKAANKGPIS